MVGWIYILTQFFFFILILFYKQLFLFCQAIICWNLIICLFFAECIIYNKFYFWEDRSWEIEVFLKDF